ncbi:MAG: prepilin-type N-terminal cleavage/methylation domain-containing protein [Kiritimatiellia bacterium]|nr:prepilin-type N-terminal cleavage/methylation domain-containing protein [Kiritimatiellia bacterium]
MRRTCRRPIFRRSAQGHSGSPGFTLIEALVALAIAVFLALTVARLATSALERERRARLDADAARAIRFLTTRLADPDTPVPDELELSGGWRAVRQPERTGAPGVRVWQTWSVYAPDILEPHHVFELPSPDPEDRAEPKGLP